MSRAYRTLILIADDDAEDREMLEEAIIENNPGITSYQVQNGQEVIDFLERNSGSNPPSAIVLDYNMPKLTGAQVLAKLFGDERYKDIPKFVWSTSNAPLHVSECMKNGATKYFIKPDSPGKLEILANEIIAACEK